MKIKKHTKKEASVLWCSFFRAMEYRLVVHSQSKRIKTIQCDLLIQKLCQICTLISKVLKHKQQTLLTCLKQWETTEACKIHQFTFALWDDQLTRNHRLHPWVNMLRCWEKKNQVN